MQLWLEETLWITRGSSALGLLGAPSPRGVVVALQLQTIDSGSTDI